jgi:2-dehydro-3-deoxyphosphooctonate aldolase (KDO 8-P synthase)
MEKNQKNKPLLIAGPCIIESSELAHQIAKEVKAIADKYGMRTIFKGSYQKANRTSHGSFTGIGRKEALQILRSVRDTGMPVITDVHETTDVTEVADYVTHLQVPAFLCRQTDLILKCSDSGLPTNIKKGQFLSPEACRFVTDKFRSGKGKEVWMCERGFSFGYNDLIVDAICIPRIKEAAQCPVILDCTHSLQKPNRSSGTSGGNPALVGTLAKFAFATGADGLFIEVHPNPKSSPSDSESILELSKLEEVIEAAMRIYNAASPAVG